MDFASANIAQNQIRHGVLEILCEIEEQGNAMPTIQEEIEKHEKSKTIIQNADKI